MANGRTEQILVRTTPALRSAIEQAAAANHRSLSDMIRQVLLDWVVEHVSPAGALHEAEAGEFAARADRAA